MPVINVLPGDCPGGHRLKRGIDMPSKLPGLVAAVFALCISGATSAAAETPAASQETESAQQARARLMAMAELLAGLDKFSFKMRAGYDVPQASGQMIEFGERRHVSVRRPNRARIEQRASDGSRDLVLFDGKHITVFDADSSVFAYTPQPEDLDTAIMYLLRDLHMRLPLAPLLMTSFPQELQRHLQAVEFVETTDILGPEADHIAARTDEVDFQVWIATGKRAWPLRIVITYRQLDGYPQFWADLSDWDAAAKFDKLSFVFEPPADATRIPFAAQFSIEPPGPATGDKPTAKGAEQ
jgi:hypothetical protein